MEGVFTMPLSIDALDVWQDAHEQLGVAFCIATRIPSSATVRSATMNCWVCMLPSCRTRAAPDNFELAQRDASGSGGSG